MRSTTQGGPNNVQNGLVLHLDAANPYSYVSGSTTWNDLSGRNNHIQLNGPTYNTASAGCISFDGVDDFGTINSNSTLSITNPTLIVACTVNTGTVLSRGGNGSFYNYGLLTLSNTTFRARNTLGDTLSPSFSSRSGFNIYGMVWNGSSIDFYRNGEYGGSSSDFYSPSTNNSLFLRIGCNWDNVGLTNGSFYSGRISLIQLYNRALSSSEVIHIQDSLKSRYGVS